MLSALREGLRIFLPVIIIGLGVVGFYVISQREPPPPRDVNNNTAPLVRTLPVQEHKGPLAVDVDGVVVPFRDIELSAEVGGRIEYKNPACDDGYEIKKGTLLLRIDPRDYKLEVSRLQAEYEQAVAALKELEVDIASTKEHIDIEEKSVMKAQSKTQRLVRLVRSKTSSAADLENAEIEELAARRNLQTRKGDLARFETSRARLRHARDVAKAKLDKAKLDLGRTEIYAPIDGFITTCDIEQDKYVKEDTLLVKIRDISKAEIICNFREDQIAWVWQQQRETPKAKAETRPLYRLPKTKAKIFYDLADQTFCWYGHLDRYEGTPIDLDTRTFRVRVVVPKPSEVYIGKSQDGYHSALRADAKVGSKRFDNGSLRTLMPGTFVNIRVYVETETPLVSFAEKALRPGNRAWIVRNDRLLIRPIQVARIADGQVIAVADSVGLDPERDRVVVSPLPSATDGLEVREEKR